MMPQDSLRKGLIAATVAFANQMLDWRETKDEPMRQVHTENFRRTVTDFADNGCETSLAWHTLGFWTDVGKERIGCFARALEATEMEIFREPPAHAALQIYYSDTKASCYYEIARVHRTEGSSAVALDFLSRALLSARDADLCARSSGLRHKSWSSTILRLRAAVEKKLK